MRQAETAVAAYRDTDRTTLRERVFRCVLRAGEDGATILEIADELGMQDKSITGRLAELQREGAIHVGLAKRSCKVNGRTKQVYVRGPLPTGQLSLRLWGAK